MSIKNAEVEALVAEVARIAGETKTEAIRRALLERRDRLVLQRPREARLRDYFRHLETDVWPNLPAGQRGRTLTREEEDELLGYDERGLPT